jgi:RNA polymerase sigma-70 factor (sigma-E family)
MSVDSALVNRAKLGDIHAFEQIVERYYGRCMRFARGMLRNPADVDDVVQETFVRLYRAAGRLRADGVKAYARATIVNLARTGARRRARELSAHRAPDAVAATDPGPRDELWRALLTLSPRQRACVALRFYDDMAERDVADALGMSIGSVKKHTNRALTKLREVLGRQS